MEKHHFAEKNEQIIEYYSNEIKNDKTPVIISMGNWEPAFRGLPLLNTINDRLCIVLSYRGRGKSFVLRSGWDWINHAEDLELIFEKTKLKKAVFIAFSKGVSYTLGFLENRTELAKGLVLIDYPAIHTAADEGYAKFWYNMNYNGIYLKDHIDLAALEGIESESTDKEFYDTIKLLKCPIAVFVGRNKELERPSNLNGNDIKKYKAANAEIEVIGFEKSGHMILDEEFENASKKIGLFLKNIE